MRFISVLPVGNGACSVIRQSRDYRLTGDSDTVSIIDCGNGSGSGKKAAGYLEAELSSQDWDALQSLVITHWDADHWKGFQYFAGNTTRPVLKIKRKLVVYSPAIPLGINPRTQAAILTFISSTSGSGVEAIDFLASWKKRFDVEFKPVARGNTIELAGRPYAVVWPPRNVSGAVADEAAGILKEIEDLAADNPLLREALNKAYSQADGGAFGPFDGEQDGEDYDLSEEFDGRGSNDEDLDAMTDPFDGDDDANDRLALSRLDGQPSGTPILKEKDHGSLIKRARHLQNLFSLVFHDSEGQSLIVYGDAPEKVVESLIPGLQHWYLVQLAPHHGTHAMPLRAPVSRFCVAQCSPSQRRAWSKHIRAASVDLAVCDFEPAGIRLPLNFGWHYSFVGRPRS